MTSNSGLRRMLLIAIVLSVITVFSAFPMQLDAQEDVLPTSDPNIRALRKQREALLSLNPMDSPISRATSPDVQALEILDEAASSSEHQLRSVIDLLVIYENLKCEADRTIVSPLLQDRVHLSSRMLGLDAERAAIPLNTPGSFKLPETGQKALKLRDQLLAAKDKLDSIAGSLK